jgi:hypothetical protein
VIFLGAALKKMQIVEKEEKKRVAKQESDIRTSS